MLLRHGIIIILILYPINASLTYIPYTSEPRLKIFVYGKHADNDDVTIVSSLPVGSIIDHCNIGRLTENVPSNDRKLLYRLGAGIIGLDRKALKWTRCLSKISGWIMENSHLNCQVFDVSVDFPQIFDLSDEEIIVITCISLNDEYIHEIFIEDYPRIQVFNLFSNVQRNVTSMPDIYLPHGFKIPCISNFPSLTNNQWKKIEVNSQPDYSMGQFLLIIINETLNPTELEAEPNEYQCTLQYTINDEDMSVSARYRFFVQVNYIVSLVDVNERRRRIKFDVGETIHCDARSNYLLRNQIWYNTTIIVSLYSDAGMYDKFQDSSENLVLKDYKNIVPPINLYVTCSIQGQSSSAYIILKRIVDILTSTKTTYTHTNEDIPLAKFTDMRCVNTAYSIYLYDQINIRYPLSSKLANANYILRGNTNETASLTIDDFLSNKRFFVVCINDDDIMSPVELYRSDSKLIYMNPVFPNFVKQPVKQMKGFIYECKSESPDFRTYWDCPLCTAEQIQKVVSVNAQHSYLTIVADKDMIITYECVAAHSDLQNAPIRIPLLLNIYGGMTIMLQKPTYFYFTGDIVMCMASRISSKIYETIEIIIPTRLFVTTSTDSRFISTDYSFDPAIERSWAPVIPKQQDATYKACCLQYDLDRRSEYCIETLNINVVVNYTFKFNYDIPSVFVYPGNVIRCCILTLFSSNRFNWHGDNNKNCLPAMIIYYANQNPNTTAKMPGDIIAEGTQVVVPDLFLGKDITLSASFVKCHTYNQLRMDADLAKSSVQLKITSCAISPPPLVMLPTNQTLFFVNNTITCIPDSDECQSTLLFKFIIQRKGVTIDIIPNIMSINLLSAYLGKNIRVICELGSKRAYRDISVERIPFHLEIIGLQKIMTINSTLTCSSDGYPEPQIIWRQINGLSALEIFEHSILIRKVDRSGDYEFICIAFNTHGESSTNVKFQLFNVFVRKPYFSIEFYLIIYLELFLYFGFLVVIVYLLFWDFLFQRVHVRPLTFGKRQVKKKE